LAKYQLRLTNARASVPVGYALRTSTLAAALANRDPCRGSERAKGGVPLKDQICHT
jgi:hypothetical protein